MRHFHLNLSIYIVLITAEMLFSACSKLTRQEHVVAPSGSYSQIFQALDASTVMDLSEQAYLFANKVASPISQAQYFPAKNVVMALYSNDGFLRTWNAEEHDLLSELNLGITGNSSVAFDKYGDLVMGAMRSMIQENDYGELTERVGGVGIWKTSSGDLITCVVYPCEGNAPLDEWQRHLISGATFDLKGRWVLSNYETLIGITDITDKETPYSISFTDIDANHREVALVTIDSLNDRFASAFIDGGILIQGLGQKNLDFLTPKIRLGDEQKASRHKISALVFSVDGQWLARLQDGIMSIWKLETRKGDLYFESSISDGKILTFDPSSELLFVARNDQIDIWNIRETQLIRELSAPEITSLSVSSDNRLLIWGDNLGTVHIWGVRR